MRKLQSGTIAERQDLSTRLTQMIKERWPDESVTGYLASDRVLAMAEIFAGRADTLNDVVNELPLFFERPDWDSQEARELLKAIDPVEYGESLSSSRSLFFPMLIRSTILYFCHRESSLDRA